MRTIKITTEDDCWISNRLKAHYNAVKKSKKTTKEQKDIIIQKLAERAHRLGFEELCNWMGYTYFKIDLGGDRFASIFYPTDKRKEAFESTLKHLNTLSEIKENAVKP